MTGPAKRSVHGDILVIDDDLASLRTLSGILSREGYEVRGAADGKTALMLVDNEPPELILLDVRLPGMDGYEVYRQLRANEGQREIPVLFLSALDDVGDRVKEFASGAVDFITKPFQAEEILARVGTSVALARSRNELERRVAERTAELAAANAQLAASESEIRRLKERLELEDVHLRDEVRPERLELEDVHLRDEVRLDHQHGNIVGHSPEMQKVLQQVEQVASTDSTVLVQGETGTGKELIAHAIHDISPRKRQTLVKVNCAALPATLVESELFGREKGAYTGALTKQAGRFEVADGSTLFLDEVGELSLEMQAKLLRVLQEGQFERLGSSRSIQVDVRVVAATNRDLASEVQDGRFREDLFYRLNVFPIEIPPLRERSSDIQQLVWHFVRELGERMGKRIEQIPKGTMDALQQYPWPGNVRELRNVLERALIVSQGAKLTVELPTPLDEPGTLDLTLEAVDRSHIIRVLERVNWRVRGTGGGASLLGLKPTTLEFRMKKLGIERPKS